MRRQTGVARTNHRSLFRPAAGHHEGHAAVIWIDQVVQGTLLGGYYALIACGLSLMFGVMRIINLAHGDFAILGVFAVWLLVEQTGISPFLALAAAIPLMALL